MKFWFEINLKNPVLCKNCERKTCERLCRELYEVEWEYVRECAENVREYV